MYIFAAKFLCAGHRLPKANGHAIVRVRGQGGREAGADFVYIVGID